MANAGSCVSTMEIPCFGSPRRLNLRLYISNTRKGHSGRLASLASHHCFAPNRHGQRHCGTWAEKSRMSSLLVALWLEIGRSPGIDARVIPRVDSSAALVIW